MSRITDKQLHGTVRSLNTMLERRGSVGRVYVQGRNGYTSLDLTEVGASTGSALRTLTTGTKSEVWGYLHAMREALWLLEPPFTD